MKYKPIYRRKPVQRNYVVTLKLVLFNVLLSRPSEIETARESSNAINRGRARDVQRLVILIAPI